MEWLLAKLRSFSNLPAFLDLNSSAELNKIIVEFSKRFKYTYYFLSNYFQKNEEADGVVPKLVAQVSSPKPLREESQIVLPNPSDKENYLGAVEAYQSQKYTYSAKIIYLKSRKWKYYFLFYQIA